MSGGSVVPWSGESPVAAPAPYPGPGSSWNRGARSAGLYLHIPFCRSKCGYCAFVSLPCRRPSSAYLEALLIQAAQLADLPWSRERVFFTIFIGGGTPTIYDAATLTRLLGRLRELFRIAPDAEISLESNPNTLTPQGLRQLRREGYNRLSMGVQSFNSELLRIMGRSHRGDQASRAVKWAKEAGFSDINLDFIYGLPGQSAAALRDDLEQALELVPTHLALYQLTLEEGTPMAGAVDSAELVLPHDDEVAEMEQGARLLLAGAGYQHYEISNYSLPGRQCRHNLNYWQNGSYLGLGAAAVSSLSGLRISNVSSPGRYRRLLEAGLAPYAHAEALGLGAAFRETVVMGLRLRDGVDVEALRRRFGISPEECYGETIAQLEQSGLLKITPGRLVLTERGFDLANQVLCHLV